MADEAADLVRPAGLPDGWTLSVAERSANVWEVSAVDSAGRTSSAAGSDLESAAAEAIAGAVAIQRQLEGRP